MPSDQQANTSWLHLSQLLQSEAKEDALYCAFPPVERQLSLLESMRNAQVAADVEQLGRGQNLYKELHGLIDQLAVFDKISRCPILGITGLLNSGKSSLLATYLSPSGRQRVLRGVSNLAGTHRFVLWLPQRWREQSELLDPLYAFMNQLFGHAPEPLSEVPDEAARQYNGYLSSIGSDIDPMSVPLIAYDSALNNLKLGLLDCPDIQTGFALSRGEPDQVASVRRQWLVAVGRLCSAFIVMTRLNSLHDQSLLDILKILRDRMPRVRRILAVNRVKARYAPEVVLQQAQSLIDQFAIDSVYMAYDYRIHNADTIIPPEPDGMIAEPDGGKQPIFFEIIPKELAGASAASPQADSVATEYLFHLGHQLDAGVLAVQSRQALVEQLKVQSLHLADWHTRNPELRQQQIADAWNVIASACYNFMVEHDANCKPTGLRLQTSPAIINQLTDSLQRTSPGWMKLSLKIDRAARSIQETVAASAERFKVLQNVSQSVSQAFSGITKRFRSGQSTQLVTPELLSRSLKELDIHDALRDYPDEQLHKDVERSFARFADEDKTKLDQAELDKWSQSIWDNMPMSTKLKRSVQPLALLTAPVVAALLVPVDMGGTSVLVFASAKELLAAVGAAALLPSMFGGAESLKIVQEETPWRQLSDLFAILCDALGLPRPSREQLPSCGASDRVLLPSNIPVQTQTSSTHFCLWLPAHGSVARLQSVAQRTD